MVYTDEANNLAYNVALVKEGLELIAAPGRITRGTVAEAYPELTAERLARIISHKEAVYSVETTYVNDCLLQFAKRQGRDSCFIWSSANPARASAVVEYHGLREWFSGLYFSKKTDIRQEVEELFRYFSFSPRDVVVYEDTDPYIQELRSIGITVVDVKDLSRAQREAIR